MIAGPFIHLKLLTVSPPAHDAHEVRLYATIRNEITRLPYFLDYYRKLGVDRFLFVDNNSDDGTTDYLLQQHDCHVWHTTDSYRAAKYGVTWQNHILDMYGVGHWCVVVDADELLIYPSCETVNIRRFCDYLDQSGAEGLYTFMLDMYHGSDMAAAVCEPGKPFMDICPMFDRDYHFVSRSFLDLLKLPNRPPPFPETEVIGGPRGRLFYPEQNTPRQWPRLKARLMGRALKLLAKVGLVSEDHVPHMASILFKVPLVKWAKGMVYFSSTHIMTPIKLADVTGVLLHFKFFADFHDRAVIEAARGEHDGGGRQYRRYASIMDANAGKASLRYEGSVEYKSSNDVMHNGLMHGSQTYEDFLRGQHI
jgi:hypothetical protein